MVADTAQVAGTAHPRSRGENLMAIEGDIEPGGSSPLTRGKRERRRDPVTGARLIPAHAGKTVSSSRMYQKFAAHPRSRGENSMAVWKSSRLTGSSPLTRGKRHNHH